MIQRPDLWDDGASKPSQTESIPALEEALHIPRSYHLTTKMIGDSQLTITCTLIDAPGSPKNASLARTRPLLFTALDPTGAPRVTYALDTGKLSPTQRSLIGGLLDEVHAQHSRGDNTTTALRLLKAIFKRTQNIKDAWSTDPANGSPVALSLSTPPLMTPYIPPVLGYLKDPSKLGRVYQSRDGEAPKAPTVMIELDPELNRARFILGGASSTGVDPVVKPTVITVPGPVQGSLCAETAMRRLSVMSWNALEKLQDEGFEKFCRHLNQLRSEKPSGHIKNLPTGASLQVFATPAATDLVLASRPFRAKGNEEPAPARCILRVPGNTQNPDHPLHDLLADLAIGVETPDSVQDFESIVGRLVDTLRGCNRSSIRSLAPDLHGMFDPDTLKRLASEPGITLEPVAPGDLGNLQTLKALVQLEPFKAQLARAITEVSQGISRVQVRPSDSVRWRSFPEAFDSLTMEIYPDRSLMIRARNACGASLQCFLSEASRFPAHFPRDLAALICKTFARQVEEGSVVESRRLLLDVLSNLVKTDLEHNFLSYRAPPPIALL